jgi:hypothetical protein
MDVIPLDATLVKGSHGRLVTEKTFQPVLINGEVKDQQIQATEVYDVIWRSLFS